MAYFIVQVQTNFEKYVLSNLTELLLQKKVNIVKSIYALDAKIDFESPFDDDDIREYLKQSRIRTYLNNVRYAYYQYNCLDSKDQRLKECYKEQIRELTKQINKYPSSQKNQNNFFIKGYIIIELRGKFQEIPPDLYHDIKSIPKVISIPNKLNVPEQEINYYFRQVKKRKKAN
jgi:hypothetical protein